MNLSPSKYNPELEKEYAALFWESRRMFFQAFLAENKMYYTLALASQIKWKTMDLPFYGMVQFFPEPTITISYDTLKMWKTPSLRHCVYSVYLHELRHLVQGVETRFDLIDLTPITNVYQILHDKATNPEAKEIWKNKIEALLNLKSKARKEFVQKIINYAADAALNEDLQRVFPEAIPALNKLTHDSLPEDKRNPTGQYFITVQNLNNIIPDPDNETIKFPHYLNLINYEFIIVDRIARMKSKEDPNNPSENEKKEAGIPGGKDELLEELDKHDFEGNADAIRRILEELKEKAKQSAEKMERQIGSQSQDADIFGNPNKEISADLQKQLQKIKLKLIKLTQEVDDPTYTFSRKHRKLKGLLPGDSKSLKPKKSLVVVCDTSGSVFSNLLFSKMCAIAKMFYKRKELLGMYSCDTELTKINLDTLLNSKVAGVGGGGTTFDNFHITQIRKDLNLTKEFIDIVYITDLCVDLTEVMANSNIKVHLVDILSEKMKTKSDLT